MAGMPYRRRPSRISPIPAVVSTRVIDVDGMPVEVTRKRIRNMYLRIKPPAGEIVVSAPARMPERTIVGFVRGRREWIEQQRERMAQARREALAGLIADDGDVGGTPASGSAGASNRGSSDRKGRSDSGGMGDDLFSAGGLEPIDGGFGRRPDDPGPASDSPSQDSPASDGLPADDPASDRIHDEPVWTDERRKRAEEAINAALPGLLAKWTPVVGKSPTHITLRLMTSRWGSCTPKTGRIRLNLQLGLMEPGFLEYVLVHELTHLWEHGHGERFRARMDAYLPRWRELRRELNRRIVL